MDNNNDSSLLSRIYGALNTNDRQTQWDYLSNIKNHHHVPWTVVGDFNFILNNHEKQGGNIVSQTELDANALIFANNDLNSMNYIGNPFTWSNRRHGNELILERLDRVVATLDWFNKFPNAIC